MKTTVLFAMAVALTVTLAPAASADPAYAGTIKQGDYLNDGVWQKPYPSMPKELAPNLDGLGRQEWGKNGGPDITLGLDFRVDMAEGIGIDSLGIWDDNGDGLATDHILRLWDIGDPYDPVLLAEVYALAGTGDLNAGYRYFAIPGVHLAQGAEFTVSVYYPTVPGSHVDSNGNSGAAIHDLEPTPIFNDAMGAIANIGAGRYGLGNVFPDTLDYGPSNRYHSGSFNFTPNPEPGTMALLGSVLAAAGIVRRRRRRAKQSA
jgi:hypothetical protein